MGPSPPATFCPSGDRQPYARPVGHLRGIDGNARASIEVPGRRVRQPISGTLLPVLGAPDLMQHEAEWLAGTYVLIRIAADQLAAENSSSWHAARASRWRHGPEQGGILENCPTAPSSGPAPPDTPTPHTPPACTCSRNSANPTATLWTGDPPEVDTSGDRGAMMPKRRHTRAHTTAKAIEAERKLNDAYVAERNKPPPF